MDSGARKVVTFDGGGVTEGEVQEAVERLGAASPVPGAPKQNLQPGTPQYEAAKRQVIPQLLAFNLTEAYAEENGIEVSEEEVQTEIDTVRDQVAEQAAAAGETGTPEEVFQQALDQFGYTEAAFREEVRTSLLLQEVQQEVVGDAGPAEEEVQQFYDENRDTQFTIPERRCLRHILFTEDQEQEAEDVQQQLEDGGDFAELAEEYSQDPGTADQGGELGCQAEGAFVPEFDEAAFGAEETGVLEDPVETEFGYHVIEVTDIQEEEQTPLEEAAPEIEERLGQQQQATEFDAWIQEELEERDVRYLPGYDPNEQALPGGPEGELPEGAIPEAQPPEGAVPESEAPEGEAPEEIAPEEAPDANPAEEAPAGEPKEE